MVSSTDNWITLIAASCWLRVLLTRWDASGVSGAICRLRRGFIKPSGNFSAISRRHEMIGITILSSDIKGREGIGVAQMQYWLTSL